MGEADRRLAFFTETDGAVSVVAKAARRSRKRFGGALQKYFLLEVGWTEEPRRMPILTSASILVSFWDIVADWDRVRYADYLLELASSLFPQSGHKTKAFAFLLAGFRSLSGGETSASVGRKAEAAFLSLGGWGPELSGCLRCGRAESGSFRFVVSEGRLYCLACSGKADLEGPPGVVSCHHRASSDPRNNTGRITNGYTKIPRVEPRGRLTKPWRRFRRPETVKPLFL